nr:MAG TPA: hypothetical protein [Caudoviricetes sp.]
MVVAIHSCLPFPIKCGLYRYTYTLTHLITHIVARSSLLMSSQVVSSSRILTTWLFIFQRTISVFTLIYAF